MKVFKPREKEGGGLRVPSGGTSLHSAFLAPTRRSTVLYLASCEFG